nr:hypothetical protein CFP56_36720 [Quercus suber]
MIALDSVSIIEHLWRTKQKLLKSSEPDGTSNSCKCTWRMGACSIICQTEHVNPKEDDQEKENPEENEIQEKEYPWLSYNILQDLILLENQVPFFVLEELYNSAYHDLPYDDRRCQQNEDKSFRKLVIDYFYIFGKIPVYSALLFTRNFCLPILEIPSFTVGDATECVIRNLMAICNYIVLLDHLINTAEDVDLLVEKKVLVNWLGSNKAVATLINKLAHQIVEDHLINTAEDVDLLVEKKVLVNWLGSNKAVATLINKLAHQIVEGNHSCYYDISYQIHVHNTGSWNKLIASLKSQYFRDFWRGTTTFAGILVLFFAFWNFLRPFVFHR